MLKESIERIKTFPFKLCKVVKKQLGIRERKGMGRNVIPSEIVRKNNQKEWENRSRYHRRLLVESVSSIFKRVFE